MIDESGEPLSNALREFKEFIGDLDLVAFNAKFDSAFLKRASKATGVPINNRIHCALQAARRAWPGLSSYKLGDLIDEDQVTNKKAHRALADCERALIVYVQACHQS